jgi:sugar phosphate isomerase/epimerase
VYRGAAASLILYEQQGRDIDMRACLAEMSVGQFSAVEGHLDKYFATRQSAEEFSAALRVDNQSMWTAYMQASLDEQPAALEALRVVSACVERAKGRDVGFMGVVFTPAPVAAPRGDEQLQALAQRLEEVGAAVVRRGAYLGLHNDEALSRDGARELRYLLQHTTPANVAFCPDVAWLHRAGVDAVKFLSEFKDRVRTLHVRQSRGGVWLEDFGDGDIDYRPIDRVVRPLRQDVRVVWDAAYEQATKLTRRTVDDIKLSRQYLRRIFSV